MFIGIMQIVWTFLLTKMVEQMWPNLLVHHGGHVVEILQNFEMILGYNSYKQGAKM